MWNQHRNCILFALSLLFLWGCRESFTPPKKATEAHYLVVEGFINADGGQTVFMLSRTRSLRDTGYTPIGGVTPPVYETGARVAVEDNQGNTFPLSELDEGKYGAAHLSINPQNEYRLTIETKNGKKYQSAFVSVSPTPVIDSVYWKLQSDGVRVYFDSYNKEGVTRYYRWTYEETWEIHTKYHSQLIYRDEDTSIIERPPDQYVDVCYPEHQSNRILIGNTAKLTDNSLSGAEVTLIPNHDQKLGVLYSVLLKVYAISKDEFEFWERMKKNTEEMGTIFAPQPSTVRGNMTCVSHPGEPVIGYVSVHSASAKKRLFIHNDELPSDWNINWYQCQLFNVVNNKDSIKRQYFMGQPPFYFTPVKPIKNLRGVVTAYEIARRHCADCTASGGTTTKPSFWP